MVHRQHQLLYLNSELHWNKKKEINAIYVQKTFREHNAAKVVSHREQTTVEDEKKSKNNNKSHLISWNGAINTPTGGWISFKAT